MPSAPGLSQELDDDQLRLQRPAALRSLPHLSYSLKGYQIAPETRGFR
jgi:hypothetical protein